jgi:hypothetical protein
MITTISLTDSEKEFIDQNNLSPTLLIKTKLAEIQEFRAKPLLDRIERLLAQLEKYSTFLDKKGLLEEFCKQ